MLAAHIMEHKPGSLVLQASDSTAPPRGGALAPRWKLRLRKEPQGMGLGTADTRASCNQQQHHVHSALVRGKGLRPSWHVTVVACQPNISLHINPAM